MRFVYMRKWLLGAARGPGLTGQAARRCGDGGSLSETTDAFMGHGEGRDRPGPRRCIPNQAGREHGLRMFGFKKKDPRAKLQKQYEALTAQAVELQRNGDIRGFAAKTAEAKVIEEQLDALERGNG